MNLTSKIQYKNFETGEFIEENKRTFEETIEIIEQFPWTKERDDIVIDLTNPSITIEGENGDYLKLAVYFNQKFVLHYLDHNKILFDKSFIDIRDSYNYIEKFFGGAFDTTDFRKQNTWLKQNLKHFVSRDFHYAITPSSINKYFWSTSGLNVAVFFIIIYLIIQIPGNPINNIGIIYYIFLMFVIGGGLNLIFLFNYYHSAKGKLLIMSKGNDEFYYGNIYAPIKYNKNEILQYTLVETRSHRSILSLFAFIKIEFKDGKIIIIPNLLVDCNRLSDKLFQHRKIIKGRIFPFIKA